MVVPVRLRMMILTAMKMLRVTHTQSSRRSSGLRKTTANSNSLAHSTTCLRSDFGLVVVVTKMVMIMMMLQKN